MILFEFMCIIDVLCVTLHKYYNIITYKYGIYLCVLFYVAIVTQYLVSVQFFFLRLLRLITSLFVVVELRLPITTLVSYNFLVVCHKNRARVNPHIRIFLYFCFDKQFNKALNDMFFHKLSVINWNYHTYHFTLLIILSKKITQ